jgi:hypothetical protein
MVLGVARLGLPGRGLKSPDGLAAELTRPASGRQIRTCCRHLRSGYRRRAEEVELERRNDGG